MSPAAVQRRVSREHDPQDASQLCLGLGPGSTLNGAMETGTVGVLRFRENSGHHICAVRRGDPLEDAGWSVSRVRNHKTEASGDFDVQNIVGSMGV